MLVREVIRRDYLDNVLFCTHFVNNTEAARSNYKFENIRPLFELLKTTAKHYLPRSDKVSMDEIMIPTLGGKGSSS